MTSASPGQCSSCGKPLRPGRTEGLCAICLSRGWKQAKTESASTSEVETLVPSALFELPGHEITSEIARGGMGIVYRARQRTPERDVAIKMLLPQIATETLRERFRNEAHVMASLTHPGILPLFQYGQHAGVPWFSMPLCASSLAQRRTNYHGQWRRTAELMAGLADATAFAHAHGVLHRDIKPGNVLFDDQGQSFLSDFGLAKLASDDQQLTRSISVIGTPHYLAPEVIKASSSASTSSDVYALGAILYELLAGRPVFDAASVPAILRLIAEEEPSGLPHNVPRDLATIALKCLSKDASSRYASAQALAEDLRRWLNDEPVQARRISSAERFVLWCKRKPALAGTSAMLIASLALGVTMIVAKNRELRTTLRTSLLNEARSTRMAARVQGRHEALEAIRQGAMLGSSPELEAEAASLLALPSLRLTASLPASSQHWKVVPDAAISMAADYRDGSVVRIVALPSMNELAHLPGGDAAWGGQQAFSNDGRLIVYDEGSDFHTVVRDWRTGETIVGPLNPRRRSPRFSPDSKTLAAGAPDGRMEIYDLTKPGSAPQVWPAGGLPSAEPLAFSPDGRWLAVRGNSHQVSIFGTDTGQVHVTFGDRADGVTLSGAWFGDSQGMMLGSTSGRVRSWIITSQTSRLLPVHAAQVYGVAVHPQGQIALSSAYDARTWIIDWPSGRPLGMEAGNSFLTRFSLDGTHAIMHDQGQARLRIYEVAMPSVCRQFTLHAALGGYRPPKGSWCAEVSPDGRLLACSNFGETTFYDVSSSRYLGLIKEGGGNTQAWAKGGRELWMGTGLKLVRYGLEPTSDGSITVSRLSELPLQGTSAVRLSIADKAKQWAVSVGNGFCHGTFASSDVSFVPAPPEMPAQLQLNPLTLSPDGRWVAVSAEFSSKLGIYDLHEKRWAKFFDPMRISYTWFVPGTTRLWIGTWTDHWLIDTTTWSIIKKIADRSEPGALGFTQGSADGRLMVSLDGMSVVLRHGATGEPFLRLKHPVPMTAAWMNITADGRFLTYSGLGHIQQVWDLAQLATEMQALGLPWRGPSFGSTAKPLPVRSLRVPQGL